MTKGNRSPWNLKYWDIAEQFYWAPQYVGLRSITQKQWQITEDRVSVPKELVNFDGPLYARVRKDGKHKEWMRNQEEVLNHVFDLTFAIAPDELIDACFAQRLQFQSKGQYQSLGREIRERFGWTWSENVTQQDGFFVSDNSAIGVELKLGSLSNLNQIVKYAALLAWEEGYSGPKSNVGLLYIIKDSDLKDHWKNCGLTEGKINSAILETLDISTFPRRVRDLLLTDKAKISSVLDRMVLGVATWADLKATCLDFLDRHADPSPGNQTLERLVHGFIAQIDEQVAI